jgi:DNA invertase Pin-like site-specific DNA recombinase
LRPCDRPQRTRAGLAAARARGRNGGRKSKLSGKKLAHAGELLANRDISVVAATLGVDRSTLYRALARKEKVMPHSA